MIERIEINLLPAEYRYHKRTIHLKRELVYPILFIAVLCFILISMSFFQQSTVSDYQHQIDFVSEQVNRNRPVQNEIYTLRDQKQIIQEKIIALERINVNREKWVRLMEEFSKRLPEFSWLISIKEDASAPIISIEGRTYSFPEVATYMSSLKESPYVTSVDLSTIDQIDTKTKLYKFFITCKINPDVKLKPLTTESVVDAQSKKSAGL